MWYVHGCDFRKMDSVQVECNDVVKLIAQFLSENEMFHTLEALKSETKVTIDYVESKESFLKDVKRGAWDKVLSQTRQLNLPEEKLCDLYELIVLELIENREIGAAKTVLRQTEVMQYLAEKNPDRYLELDELASKPYFDVNEVYGGNSKQIWRENVGKKLEKEIKTVDSSRLLTLLGQAVKFQQGKGIIPADIGRLNLFEGYSSVGEDEQDEYPKTVLKTVKFAKGVYPQSVAFSPDGTTVITGCVDGLIELRSSLTGKLRKDCIFQKEGKFMLMSSAISALCFSTGKGYLLATGNDEGKIRVWDVRTGKTVQKFGKVHSDGITCLCFAQNNCELVSASFDNTVKIHGLTGGTTLKTFRGHISFVNCVITSQKGKKLASGSADGTVKFWDIRTTDCDYTLAPPNVCEGKDVSICKLLRFNMESKEFIIIW